MRGLRFIVFGLLFISLEPALAQFQSKKNLIKHYSVKDGLSQSVVNSITQDNQSLMWFATEDGLNRFDGYAFKTFRYDPDNKTSIADNFVQSIFKDSEGTLWVSSRKGLLEFDSYKETFTLYQHDFKGNSHYAYNDVSFITEGHSGNLWISWYGTGFASFDKKTKSFSAYTPETLPGLSNEKTVALLEDKFGLLWVGTQEGGVNVFQVSKGKVIKKVNNFAGYNEFASSNVHCFAEDKYGNIWIGTSQGLVVYLRNENRFFAFNDPAFSVSKVSVISLHGDTNENLWIGSQGVGLYQLDLRQFTTHAVKDFIFVHVKSLKDYDLSKRTIQFVYEDKDKDVWIGTFGDGVYLVSNAKENFVKLQKPLYENSAVSFVPYYGMCHDQDGNLWLGTDGNGIYKSDLNGHVIEHYTAEKANGKLKDNAILSALNDRKGRLWFGSYSHGLFRYNSASNSFINYHYKNATKPGGNDVRVIFEDSKNNIWIGTNRGGLCLLNEKDNTYENPSHFGGTLLGGDVRSITEDNEGNLWIGFYGDGVYSYNLYDKKWKRHSNDLKSDIVFAVKTDGNNKVWMGTGGGGLCVFDPKQNKFKRYTEKDGLSNNTIYAILIDNDENVWVSTNSGVSKFDAGKNKFTNYNTSDGLQEGQFNQGSALFNEVGGYMCFGGTLGYNIFYPDQIKTMLKKPEVMLSGLSLFNKPIKINESVDGNTILNQVISRTKEITLAHDQNVLTFEFVGLNYSYPEKNRYAYKLDGLDEDWNFVGNQRTATYRYLSPGDYTFKVKASNIENIWGDDFAQVAIKIKYPFWQTPLAYILYFIALVAIWTFIYSLRRKQIILRKRLKIEKSQRKYERQLVQQKLSFFTEISHEFKTPLTLMIGPLEEMLAKETSMTPMGRKLRMVNRNAHKLLSLINKLLDYRKIESGNVLLKVSEDNIVAFVEEIFITFKELANHKNINFHFHAEHPAIMVWFDKEKLEMVLNNIISNSFKYIGQGNEISVSVSRHVTDKHPKGRACIKIKDNGIGIPKKHLGNIFDWFNRGENSGAMSSGIGLSLAKKLIHLHKGEIFVESAESKGSTFSIKMPLGKDHFREEEIIPMPEVDHSHAENESHEKSILLEVEDDLSSRKGLKSLLIVEDDEEIRGFLREYFEKDYRIFEASNGAEGNESASTHHPDLIITDIMMPVMNGIDFCKLLKSNIRTSHIPVIMLTAKSSLSHHKEGIETGADTYITKPFSPEILGITIHNLLQSRETLMRFYRNLFAPDSEKTTTQGHNAIDEKFLHSIYEMLMANIDKPDFNINELCDVLNMSRSLVYKKVKMLTGLSPVEYIRSLRMQEAAKLLRTRKYKVFEVVYMVGFSDLKYFRQCFTKEFGYSPSDFIKNTETTEG
ncbi:MAG TPA: two-component regulator propeller domain-containing protein [Cyclobacteriaceae bacterium]|jgi:ligand-binding sensor domain-containing protein/signal transduction histidine kinase/DNA-binding response OmpR family regulator|nr:two-component regulator propeller domain-containing protein [Cyclobacteriaceae bacterium]